MTLIELVAKELHMKPKELLKESLKSYLNQRLSKVETELFVIAKKYGVKSIFDLDSKIQGGVVSEKDSFEDELYGSDCANKPYYSIRAFNGAGVPSSVRSEEITETETTTKETEVTTGALPGEGGQIGGAGTGGEEVVLPGEGAGDEEEVLGEMGENGLEESSAAEQGGKPLLSSPFVRALALLGILLFIGYAARKKKNQTVNPS